LNLNLQKRNGSASTHKAEKLSVKDGLEAHHLGEVGSRVLGWRGSMRRLTGFPPLTPEVEGDYSMKVNAKGRKLHTPQMTVNYLTFSAEDDDEREMLAQLFQAWEEGCLGQLLGEQCDIDKQSDAGAESD
jgi:hypothetical protein